MDSTFTVALRADGPSPEWAAELMLYGQFVGDWTTETREFLPDGRVVQSRWDVRFDWVLEGRAIQDVWITPPRREAETAWHVPGSRYSTTLRVFDPRTRTWQIVWIDPPSGSIVRQVGRRDGDGIVQDGEPDADGTRTRWVYRDIRADSFRWCNERSVDGGASWTLTQEMRARRVAASR